MRCPLPVRERMFNRPKLILELPFLCISHNSMASPPHAGYQLGHTLVWVGIPFFNQHLSQVIESDCAGHCDTNNTHADSTSAQ